MITLFGATGYTGQLIARALERRGLPFRLAGRSLAKLQALSQSLASHPPTLVADVGTPSSLTALFDNTRLLINGVGPFTDLGEPVVALAAARGIHYLDITNELAYVYRMQQYNRLARQTGAAIVPACGFEVAVADCAVAALVRERASPIKDITIVYYLGGSGVSIGTRLSGLRTFATSWLAYRAGKYVGDAPGGQVKRGTINGRPFAAINFPSAEVVTLPAHTPTRNIYTWMAISRRTAGAVSVVMPLVGILLRTPLGWLTAAVLRRVNALPDETTRVADRWSIKIEMTGGENTHSQVWSGKDAYGLTGEIIAYAAQALTRDGYANRGVLAPAQALEPEKFLEWLSGMPEVTVKNE